MANTNVKIRVAWIMGGLTVVAAVVAGLFALITTGGGSNIVNQGSGQQIVGNNNQITVKNSLPKKKGYLSILENTDVHLGDNVYPDAFGTSYNPLTQDIYPQPASGVLYFDKKTKTFKSGDAGPTRIGQYLVNNISSQILQFDYSAYQHTFAVNPGDPQYKVLTEKFKGSSQITYLGPTALIASIDLKGNYYNRYAAVGFAKSFSVVSTIKNAGIDERHDNLKVTIIIKTYHGGIRAGQNENFVLQVNDFSVTIPSKTNAMRDPAEVPIEIPIKAIYLDRPNYLFVYVLPWLEAGPILDLEGKHIRPAHFRDVGIINLGLIIEEV
jgi:hypothetical protein